MSVRYTDEEKMLIRRCQKILAKANVRDIDYNRAQATLDRLKKEATQRAFENQVKRELGQPPEIEDFATLDDFQAARDLYRLKLEKMSAARILDDPHASLKKRDDARRKLKSITVPTPDRSPARKAYRPPGEEENARKFLDELQGGQHVV
jgi:hypothetical protein